MRRRILLLLALLISLTNSAIAQGPRVAQRFERRLAPLPSVQQPAPVGNMILGGLVGGAVGFFGFGFAGALIADSQTDDGSEGFEALGGFVVGAIIGESALLPLGAHLANKRQGDYATSLLVSAGIAAVGVGLTAAMEDLGIVFLPAVPIAQLISTIAIEQKATR